jgi:hypothetical protein
MSTREQKRWKEWAERLRQTMMAARMPQLTITVDTIIQESGTEKPHKTLHSRRFWNECQTGKSLNGTLIKAGFELEFQPTEQAVIEIVTFRLNSTWLAILQRAGARF